MAADEIRWLVRLTPRPGQTVADLLQIPLSLDVWQREQDALVAVVSAMVLRELERRRLAGVERLGTTAEYEVKAGRLGHRHPGSGQ